MFQWWAKCHPHLRAPLEHSLTTKNREICHEFQVMQKEGL